MSWHLSPVRGPAIAEETLAHELCTQHLSPTELQRLAQRRGFPSASGAKGQLAALTAARLLEPRGVAEAMRALPPRELAVLHVLAASGEPLPLRSLSWAFVGKEGRFGRIDARAAWKRLTDELLTSGTVLVHVRKDISDKHPRFERAELWLPRRFVSSLPPFPVETVPLEGAPSILPCDEALRAALRALFRLGKGPHSPLTQRLRTRLDAGPLLFDKAPPPDSAALGKAVHTSFRAAWLEEDDFLLRGDTVLQLFASLPPQRGCTLGALQSALSVFDEGAKKFPLAALLADGARAGLLECHRRGSKEPVYRLAAGPPTALEGPLGLAAPGLTAQAPLDTVPMLSLLRAATVSVVTCDHGVLTLDPDRARLGRAWSSLPAPLREELEAHSKAFRQAAEWVRAREGKTLVHHGLTVLRVRDVGLHALLQHRFPEAVRALDEEHLACVRSELDKLLALTRKEGYVAQRRA